MYQNDIIGFRNILIHNYDGIDDTLVWSIIKQDLVSLKKEVLEKLETE